jgi:hypothetical protein
VLTPRGPVALLTPSTPSGRVTTPSPAYLNQADVISVPNSIPSISIRLEPSENLMEQAMQSAGIQAMQSSPSFWRKWAPGLVFVSSLVAGAGIARSLSSETTPASAVEVSMPTGVEVKATEGAVQVEHDAPVRVDGASKEHAPNATLVLPVGTHTLSSPGVTRTVEVKPLRLTKVRLRSSP